MHAVGGTLGAILTGFLATDKANANLVGAYASKNGLDKLVTEGGSGLHQLKAIGVTLALSIVGNRGHRLHREGLVGLRPTAEDESQVSTSPNTAKKATSTNPELASGLAITPRRAMANAMARFFYW